MKAERFIAQSTFDNFFQSHKSTTADEKDVGRIDREKFLMRMLAAALRRNIRDRAFQNLEQRLLHAFARDVAGDRRVLVLTANLVNLVDIDNALLGALHVTVRGLQKLEDDVLDVFADITGFGQGGRVDDSERNAQHARQGLGEQRLARSGGTD